MLQFALTCAAENGHDIDLVAAYPVFVLVGAGMLGLIIKMIMRERAGRATLVVTMLGLIGAAAVAWLYLSPDPADWHPLIGLLQLDPLGALAQIVLFGGAAILLVISMPRLSVMGERSADFLIVMAFAVSGLAIVVISLDFLTLFTGIALVLVCHIIMLSMQPQDALGTEVGLKVFISGLVSTTLLLFGMALLYGASGDTQFDGVADGLSRVGTEQIGTMALGLALVVAALAWLLGLAPMHMHVPDLYQAAPAPTAPYIAALPPLAAIVVLVRLLGTPLNSGTEIMRPMLLTLALITIVVGALLAWAQRSPRRATGYVSMVAVGSLLLPVSVAASRGEAGMVDIASIATMLPVSVTMLLALGILAGMLSRLSDDPAVLPETETAISRGVAGGLAFFIAMMLLAFAFVLVTVAADWLPPALLWIVAGAATVAAARMALVFSLLCVRSAQGMSVKQGALAMVWLLVVLAVVVAPLVWSHFNYRRLPLLLYDSLRGGM